MSEKKQEQITTRIWKEEPESDNPFAASACYCAGFDVYGDMLGKASYFQYLWLLFRLEPPTEKEAALLETLAFILANPGPRDHSIHAAMCAGVGGSTHASALIAALSVGAGNLGGAREVWHVVQYWQQCETNLDQWKRLIANPPVEERADVWLPMEHAPGFDPNGVSCPKPVLQSLHHCIAVSGSESLKWLADNRLSLEEVAGCPLAFSGLAGAVLYELGFNEAQSEMLFLMLRLPGAAVHALEQENPGWRGFPFFMDGLTILQPEKQ